MFGLFLLFFTEFVGFVNERKVWNDSPTESFFFLMKKKFCMAQNKISKKKFCVMPTKKKKKEVKE